MSDTLQFVAVGPKGLFSRVIDKLKCVGPLPLLSVLC